MNDLEIAAEVTQVMRFICGFNDAKSSISIDAVNLWLENHSDTLFVRGKLRQVVFTKVTDTMYKVQTEEI